MTRVISKIRSSYYLPLTTAVLAVFSIIAATTAWGLVGIEAGVKSCVEIKLAAKPAEVIDIVCEQQIKFAADHGVANPAALVAAVKHSSMANLLISVAIEESNGDPVAVGSAGEQGAWQVISSNWGAVPKDIQGQAGQAERIIRGLLFENKGNNKKALAQYNGGTKPPGKSYRYAERILKRTSHLQASVKFLPQNYNKIREALLNLPARSRML